MPYVTKLAKLCKEKNVLKQVLSQHRTGIDLSSSISHQVQDGNDFLLPATILECQQQRHGTQQEIRKLEKDSVTLRIEERTQLPREAIQRGDHETAKAIKYHLVAERTKWMYQKLRYITRHSENRNLPIICSLGPRKFQLQTMHRMVDNRHTTRN